MAFLEVALSGFANLEATPKLPKLELCRVLIPSQLSPRRARPRRSKGHCRVEVWAVRVPWHEDTNLMNVSANKYL